MPTELFYLIGALLAGAAVGLLIGRSRRTDAGLVQRDTEIAQLKPLAEQVPALRDKLAGESARLEAAQEQLADIEPLRTRAASAEADVAALKATLQAAEKAFAEQTQSLTRLRGEMQDQFKLLAGEVLKANSEDFTRRAEEIFKLQKDSTAAEIDRRAQEMAALVKPLSDSLASYDVALKEIENKRVTDVGAVSALLNDMKTQHASGVAATASLVNALRASPKTRGRWGEETLRRVMELSGMVENCDFETEKFFRGDESLRPDVVISLSGGRSIIVDAKAPVSAYLDATTTTNEDEKEAFLKKHAQQLRERLTNLSQKSYWERISGTTDCVVMFVPGDNFVSAAFERDPDLFEDGIKARVLICTPTTFIALAKAISYGWRQERLAQSALDVGRLGKDLYTRLSTFGDHVVDLGKHINNAAKKYNLLVGSLENSVMPQARRFNELGVEGTGEPLVELAEVDTVLKFPQGGRDLLISKGES